MEGPLSRLGSAMQIKAAFLLQFYNSQWGEWVAQGSYPYHPILSRRSTSWHLPGWLHPQIIHQKQLEWVG